MLKTTLAIMRHCHELLRGSEYVLQGKYNVCTYVLRGVTSKICVCTYDSTIIKFPQESTPFRDLSFWTGKDTFDFLPLFNV